MSQTLTSRERMNLPLPTEKPTASRAPNRSGRRQFPCGISRDWTQATMWPTLRL